MKKVFILLSIILTTTLVSKAQSTGLFTYDGGFFIKQGDTWQEYRPADKSDVWLTYVQTKENDNFYYLKSERCEVAVPKSSSNKIFIRRDPALQDWHVIYNTKDIYNHFSEQSTLIYCYKGGYFVRSGNEWHEYNTEKRYGLWDSYIQTNEDDNFFIAQSRENKIAIPKQSNNSFFIWKNGKWQVSHKTTAIYDTSATYEYNFHFDAYTTADNNGKSIEKHKCGARISFNRKGYMQIAYGNKHHNMRFSEMSILAWSGNNTSPIGVEIVTDTGENIKMFSSGYATLDLGKGNDGVSMSDGKNNSKLPSLMRQIEYDTFFTK